MQGSDIEQARARIVLSNDGNRDLWVNGRMQVDRKPTGPALPALSYPVWLEIAGPAGVLDFACMALRESVSAGDYVVLRPGARVGTTAELRCYSGMRKPGIYSATVHYLDRNLARPPEPPGSVFLGEEVVSEPVQFQVVVDG